MITITTQAIENTYSVGSTFQHIFTATFPCIVVARTGGTSQTGVSKIVNNVTVSFLSVNNSNATIMRFGNAVFLEIGHSIMGSSPVALTLYITRIDQ